MNDTTVPPERSRGTRWLLLGLLAVAIAQMVVLWLTRPEPPPAPVEGIEVALTGANFGPEVLDKNGLVLVDFWYEHCPPCRRMEPVVAHLSLNYRDRMTVGRVDVEQAVELTEQFHIDDFPVLLLFRDGQIVDRWDGYGGLNELSRWLDKHLDGAGAHRPEQADRLTDR